MKLIVGLGNPGRQFAHNRHNVGFQCLNFFAREQGISFSERRARSRVGIGEVAGIPVVLAKPATFINLSGQTVAALLRRFDISLADLAVVYDDLDIPLGQIRIRPGGGAGGHNGVKSIIAELRSQDFARIRVGIAPVQGPDSPPLKTKTPEYVLSDFTAEEKAVMTEAYPRVAAVIRCWLSEGIETAMNKFNQPGAATT